MNAVTRTKSMNQRYRTLDLNEAAEFLHMSPAVVRQKAEAGIILGAKPGKCWFARTRTA